MGLLFRQFSLRCSLIILAAVFLASSTGCGKAESSLDRKAVSGTVSYDGVTDAAGKVNFFPESGGPAVNGSIENGRYAFDATNGPVPGKYRVRVSIQNPQAGAGGRGVQGGKGGSAGSPPEFLPAKNVEIEVPADGPYEIDIEV